jgi:hypothetical protein
LRLKKNSFWWMDLRVERKYVLQAEEIAYSTESVRNTLFFLF